MLTEDVRFWDAISSKYSTKPVPDEERYQKKLAISRRYLGPESVVLEFGCGTGTTALNHAPDVKHIQAFDFSPAMIEIANTKKTRCQNAGNVEFRVGSVEEIDFGTQEYDVVMGHSILHLTFENEATLRKIYRGLKPGGVFISGTGCLKDMNILIRLAVPVARLLGKAPRINIFSVNELVTLHEETGFEIAERWDYQKGEIYLVAKKPNSSVDTPATQG